MSQRKSNQKENLFSLFPLNTGTSTFIERRTSLFRESFFSKSKVTGFFSHKKIFCVKILKYFSY